MVGTKTEAERVSQIIKQTNDRIELIDFVSPNEMKEVGYIGSINQLDQVVHIHSIDEIIFCAKDTSAQTIIHWMSTIDSDTIDFKIAQPESLYLIGSNSIDTAGDLYILNINSITTKANIRNKRTFDFLAAFCLFILSPLLIWIYRNKKRFLKNILFVLFGKRSIVGYHSIQYSTDNNLPKIKLGILSPADKVPVFEEVLVDKLNLIYARDYSITKDFSILKKAWKKLDR